MAALILSALFFLYLLIPNALFRFFLGLFVPIRVFQGTKTEEITRAVVTLGALFALSLALVWSMPGAKSWPFYIAELPGLRTADYRLIAGSLYSEKLFESNLPAFWPAVIRCARRQLHLIVWYYAVVVVWASSVGFASRRYGRWKMNRLYRFVADVYLLPHMSQWHAILTDFTFPSQTTVKADVLMDDGTLYQGEVGEHFLNSDGTLSGLFLKRPRRFDRSRYLEERSTWGTTRSSDKFWREIPSAKLYLFGSRIVNLNVNYQPSSASSDVLRKYLEAQFPKGLASIQIHRPAEPKKGHSTAEASAPSMDAKPGGL